MYQSLYFKYTVTHKVLVFLYIYVITRTKKKNPTLVEVETGQIAFFLRVLSGRFDDVCRFVQNRDDVRELNLPFSVCSALRRASHF